MTDDNFDIDVHVWIPRRNFKTLNQQATAQGVEVGHLIRALVIATVPEAPIPLNLTGAERDEYITRRNAEGAYDAAIGSELGLSQQQASHHRKRLGLPANGRNKRQKVTS